MSAIKASPSSNAYAPDLAYIHDAGFGDFSENAAPGLLKRFAEHGMERGLVVDLGCGSGLWARRLSAAGYDVLGIDISPAMVAMARERVPEGDFRAASLWEVDLPACDAVTALGEGFNYAFDGARGARDLRRLFKQIYTALRPGGLFVFDMVDPTRLGKENPIRRFHLAEDWAVLMEAARDTKGTRLTRHITTFRGKGREAYRRSDERHELRLFPKQTVAAALRAAGFRVRHLRGYGDAPFAGHQMAFWARKPVK